MNRPRLTRAQWRLLLTLAMREHAYGIRRAPAYLDHSVSGIILEQHGYAEPIGRGYRITDRGLWRARRARGWQASVRRTWRTVDDSARLADEAVAAC